MHCDILCRKRAAQTSATGNSETSAGFQRMCQPGHFEFASLERCNEIGEMFECRVSWISVPDDHSAVIGDDGSGCERCEPRRLAAVGT